MKKPYRGHLAIALKHGVTGKAIAEFQMSAAHAALLAPGRTLTGVAGHDWRISDVLVAAEIQKDDDSHLLPEGDVTGITLIVTRL